MLIHTHKNFLLVLTLMSFGLLSASCAQSLAEAKVARSDLERDTSPRVANADLQELSSGNTDFAFRLYQELREEEGNLFFSPYSISSALAMTYGGARGATDREMAETLSFTLPQERLHPAFNALDQALAERSEPVDIVGTEVEGAQLEIANSLWGQAGYSFRPEYLDLLALNYGAEMHLMDFASRADAARRTINKWVEDATEGTIKEIVPDGFLNARTRLVLVNAIYFNAKWADPFFKFATKRGSFYLLDGGEVRVPMMAQDEPFPYWKGDGFQVFELPYVGRELAMGILMPDTGKFRDVESALDARQLNAIVRNLESTYLDLKMPRFDFESEFAMRE
ncbi:MAG: serpin family protein, partial [Anaerolineales bacterium]